MTAVAVVSARGASRWAAGHAWIFRSDVREFPPGGAGIVGVRSERGAFLGWALWSPASEIALRLIERDERASVDAPWWHARIAAAVARRAALGGTTNAYRLVHAEGDGLPSLIVDRYDQWLVVQLLSAGLETQRAHIVEALRSITDAAGAIARHDATVRAREGLPRAVEPLWGDVPQTIEVHEGEVRYLAAPHEGQKTGAFLDQRENRLLVGRATRGAALDCFSYHGSFALHMARQADRVTAVDASAPALARAKENAALNGTTNVEWEEADVFEFLRAAEARGARYDTIVLDPPAFAKNRGTVAAALRGYHEINVRAMRILAPGGSLFTASCSYHITKAMFLDVVRNAAADSGRRIALRAFTVQPLDHPEVVTIPETGYLKGALLDAD